MIKILCWLYIVIAVFGPCAYAGYAFYLLVKDWSE